MLQLVDHMRERPRMLFAMAAGVVAGGLFPHVDRLQTRLLIGWNVGIWLLLALLGWMVLQADHERMRKRAVAQAESAPVILAVVVVAAVFSIVAIVGELAAAKQQPGGAHHEIGRVLFALATVAGSWLLLPTLFAFNYASIYYTGGDGRDDGEEDVDNPGAGLKFPDRDDDPGFRPDYGDFLYFSFTIAVACQTADVSISTRAMRRLVLWQALLSFVFNTTILALTINIAAGLF